MSVILGLIRSAALFAKDWEMERDLAVLVKSWNCITLMDSFANLGHLRQHGMLSFEGNYPSALNCRCHEKTIASTLLSLPLVSYWSGWICALGCHLVLRILPRVALGVCLCKSRSDRDWLHSRSRLQAHRKYQLFWEFRLGLFALVSISSGLSGKWPCVLFQEWRISPIVQFWRCSRWKLVY